MSRLGFIGGSDARRIMEGDWHTLWLEKTGQQQPADLSDNLAVQLGVHTEDFNIRWFKEHYLQNDHFVHEQHRFAENVGEVFCRGTVDGYISELNAILECKHTYDRNNMESCIRQYMPQVQFYMMVSQTERCYLSVLFGNRRYECVCIERNDDYIERMMVHISEFWHHVTQKIEPSGKQTTSLPTDHIPVDNMTRRDATGDNEFISKCHDYIEQEANAKLFESAKADLKAMVGQYEREVYCDLLTIKRDKRGALRINVKEN